MTVSKFHEMLHHYKPDARFPDAGRVLKRMQAAEKFVFTDAVLSFIQEHPGDFALEVAAMFKAGIVDLPASPMVVEYHVPHVNPMDTARRWFWMIERTGPNRCLLWYAHVTDDGQTEVFDHAWPIVLNRLEVEPYLGPIPEGEYGWGATWADIVDCTREIGRHKLFLAMALHVRGITIHAPTPIDPALERARRKRGKPPLTKNYVTIHLGFYYDAEGNRHRIDSLGHPVRMHLRRGHIRNQVCGPGLLEHKKVWIPATIVNYQPGVALEPTEYLVVP